MVFVEVAGNLQVWIGFGFVSRRAMQIYEGDGCDHWPCNGPSRVSLFLVRIMGTYLVAVIRSVPIVVT